MTWIRVIPFDQDENLRRAGEVRCGSGQFLVEKFLGDPGRRLAPEELAAAHTEGARLDAPALYRYLREDDDLVPAGETHAAALNSSRRSAAARSRT